MPPPLSRRSSYRALWFAALALAAPASPAPAAPVSPPPAVPKGSSLLLTPGDAAFYSSSLRNKEQLARLTKSNAWKKFLALSYVRDGLKAAGLDEGFGGLAQDAENKALLELITDGLSDEVFAFGDKDWVPLMHALQKITPVLTAVGAKADNPAKADPDALHTVLTALSKEGARLKVPALVVGFKLHTPAKAGAQLDRLEKLIPVLVGFVPSLENRIKRVKEKGSDFLTLQIDKDLMPFDSEAIKGAEKKPGEFAGLVKTFEATKLTVCLGVKGDRFLVGFAPSLPAFTKLPARGDALANRAELNPLSRHTRKPIVSVAYVSKAYAAAASPEAGALESYFTAGEMALAEAELPPARKKALQKELAALKGALASWTPKPTSHLRVGVETPAGYEWFAYSPGAGGPYKSVEGRLQDHFGGNPIFAAASVGKADGSLYRALVKGGKALYAQGEAMYLESADAEAKAEYRKNADALLPLLRKLDEATTTKLLPALKQTGLALVIDARWTSKQWHKGMPATPKALPMPEVALLLGLSDSKQFTAALTEYRKTLNDLYAAVRERVKPFAELPAIEIPKSKQEKTPAGVVYSVPLPEKAGVDKQVQPSLGVGKDVAVFALSGKHALRLLPATPLKPGWAPLARKGNLVAAGLLDWPALVNAGLPWVEWGIETQAAMDATKKKELLATLPAAAELLRTFRGLSYATYVEGDDLITHSEWRFQDVPKGKD